MNDKMNSQGLTLLSEGQIWGNSNESQLEVIRKYGAKAAITDLCVLTGSHLCEDTDYNIDEDKSLTDRTSCFWTRSDNVCNTICAVMENGNRNIKFWYERNGAVRPALQSSVIFSQISPNRVRGYNGTEEVEYGEYPQNAADSRMQNILESEYNRGMNKTGRSYTFDSVRYDDYDTGFKPVTYEEYEYQGKEYIRVKANSDFVGGKFKLSNGVEYRNGDYVWVEVSPVKWLIDDRTEILISKKGLVSGIRFLDKRTDYKGDFDRTKMKEYLDRYMLRDLTQTVAFTRVQNMTPEEKERFEETKPVVTNNVSVKQKFFASTVTPTLSDKDISELEKYGKVLNRKNYIVSPTIGREKELKNLMITLAQDKKRPLIVGESGVGKTAIVDELAYRIKTGEVPNFLQGKIILEVDPSNVVAGCRYVGMFEDSMIRLLNLCERFDIIVFIDEIHTIYGLGAGSKSNNDMASMLKYYVDRSNLKVIGTTTEKEYQEFFSSDALKRRFEKITVKEPTEDILYQIIDKVIEDYYVKSGISFENENIRAQIVNIILNATKKSHIVYNDMVNNPDLAISIIDKAFAFAKVYDSEFITAEHFIECFECCDRIYESIRERAIARLKNLDTSISKPVQKVLKIDFNRFNK